MSSDPIPVCAYDINADGSATAVTDSGAHPVNDGAAYRWLHFDLSAPGLDTWCHENLPPLATRTLLAVKTRPRVDDLDDGLIVTLRGINLNEGAEVEDMVSLRLWVAPRLVVSVRRQRVFAMEDLRGQIDAGNAPVSPAHLIARITESLVDRIERISLDVEDRADQLEDCIYDNGETEANELAPLQRSVIKLRRHVGPMNDTVKALATIDTPLMTKKLRHRLRDTANRATRSVEELHEVADRLSALSEHIDMVNDSRLGRNSYILSVIAAIFLPLGFLTGLFGVNVGGMPGVDSPYGFAILCGVMILVGLAGYLILRLIRWF